MKLLIAGSREFQNYSLMESLVEQALECFDDSPTSVVSGAARGADKLGEAWAAEAGLPIEQFFPDWNKLGSSAGYRRNEQMAKVADAALVFIVNGSKGATHMAELMKQAGKPCVVFKFNGVRA